MLFTGNNPEVFFPLSKAAPAVCLDQCGKMGMVIQPLEIGRLQQYRQFLRQLHRAHVARGWTIKGEPRV